MTDYKHDIEKYLNGQLSPAEMHALEKKALTDPFLADALEGAESINPDELAFDLENIHKQLNERIKEKGSRLSPWGWTLRIAAGLLVLAISTYIVLNLVGEKKNKSDLALNHSESTPKTQNQEKPSEKEISSQSQPAPSKQEVVIESQSSSERAKSNSNSTEINVKPETHTNDLALLEQEPVEMRAEREEAIVTAPSYQDSVMVTPSESFSKSSPSVTSSGVLKGKTQGINTETKMAADKKAEHTNVKIIKGKVTDAEDGTPLPGVNVVVKNTNVGTITDEEGNFEIPSDTINAELLFSFIGLQNVEVPANSNQITNVKMSADFSELSEIVVTGYSPTEPGVIREEKPNQYDLAEPQGGRKMYKNYLAKNVRYPQQAIENKIEGKVTVQFVVETTGLLNEFKVVRSIGYGCDEEVMRLIKEGPKWIPSKRNDVAVKAKVKVRMRFTLPK